MHTPTPWQIKNHVDGSTEIIANVDGDTGADGHTTYTFDYICNTEWDEFGDFALDQRTARANAAFIVTACNAHETLVSALRELAQYGTDANAIPPEPERQTAHEQAVLRARAALKLAETSK